MNINTENPDTMITGVEPVDQPIKRRWIAIWSIVLGGILGGPAYFVLAVYIWSRPQYTCYGDNADDMLLVCALLPFAVIIMVLLGAGGGSAGFHRGEGKKSPVMAGIFTGVGAGALFCAMASAWLQCR